MPRGLAPWLATAIAACLLLAPSANAQPPNDAFANAQPLSGLPSGATGSNVDATLEPGEPSHGEFSVGSVWFSWTAPASQTVTIDTCGSNYDTLLAVYTGSSLGDLRRVAGSDDACGLRSRVRLRTIAGTTYFIAVDGSEANGNIALSLTPGPEPPPPPKPREGRYGGRTFFGERISFFVRRGGAYIANFTFRNVDVTCQRGVGTLHRVTLRRLVRVRNGRFSIRARVRNGAERMSIRVGGRLLPPRRARGTLRVRTFHPLVGRCRYPFGRINWTARI